MSNVSTGGSVLEKIVEAFAGFLGIPEKEMDGDRVGRIRSYAQTEVALHVRQLKNKVNKKLDDKEKELRSVNEELKALDLEGM